MDYNGVKRDGVWFGTYYSLADAATAAEHRRTGQHTSDYANDWTGNASFSDALELARKGWNDELDAALAIAESAIEMASKEHIMDTFQPVWDVTGAEVDVGRFLSGEPECMIDYPVSKTSKEGRVITLMASIEISSSVSSESIIKRGQLIVALVMALSELGHATELWVGGRGEHSASTGCEVSILVKGVNDEIDPAAIMFAYAHPAMLRQIVFGLREKCGKTHTPRPTSRKLYPDGTIFLPEVRSSHDVPKADQFLREHLGNLGLLAE